MLRGAFIGFGNVAANGHAPGWRLRDDAKIVAATDVLASRRESFLETHPEGCWYDSVEDLLSAEPLDFVDVCAPPGAHAPLTRRALAAGLHVLCEKPLATRVEDARAVASHAARAGRVVHTVHNWLKAPICLRISALIAEGVIGPVQTVTWRTLRTRPGMVACSSGYANWRLDPAFAGGGILVDHGWHALYCVARWAGLPLAISARLETRRFHESSIEDTASLALDTKSGVSRIFLTWAADERSNEIEIEGERGHICVVADCVVVKSNSHLRRWSCPPPLSEGSNHSDWFRGVTDDFLSAATSSGAGNLNEAMLCARLIDLAQKSAAAGGVRLSFPD